MHLLEYDAYTSITRFLDTQRPLVMLDVGANVGATAGRMLDEFPNGTVYAFEPAPETFRTLVGNTRHDPRIKPVQLACGSRNGQVDFHVTQNNWCSSVLQPSVLGKRYYGEWYETRQTVKVDLVRLDDWAKAAGIEKVDFLKVDAQGYDLEVLRGAEELLANGVQAINGECQFAHEYEGCSTFSEVDQFLVRQGFALHQLHEVWTKGDEQQSSYADALWLRKDVLAALRARRDLHDFSPKGRLRTALTACQARGRTRAALYGAGQHTRRLLEHLDSMPLPIEAIIDDRPELRGTKLGRFPILSQAEVIGSGIDAIVLSSDAHEPTLWYGSQPLRQAGLEVVPLYRKSYPELAEHAA